MSTPARVYVPFTRRAGLTPLPEEPPQTLFLTELPAYAVQPLPPPPLPVVLSRALSQALLWRAVGGAVCGLVLVSASLAGLLSETYLGAIDRLVAVCTLMVLLWPVVSVGAAALRVSALHLALVWRGWERCDLLHSLREGLEASAPWGAAAWLPGLGVALSVLAECRALAALHHQPQHRVQGLALALIFVPLPSAMMSGLILAILLS